MISAQRVHQFEEKTFPFWKTIWRYFRDARGLHHSYQGLESFSAAKRPLSSSGR